MKDNKKLTTTEKAFLERLNQLPAEGKKIAMGTLAGVAAVYAVQKAKKQSA